MRDVVSSLGATALIQVSNIASGVLLARLLQPDGRGELAAVMLWPGVIAAVGVLGLHEAIAYYAARRQHPSQSVMASGLLVGALLSLLLVPIGAIVLDRLYEGAPAELRQAAFLYLAFIPLNFLGLFLVALFQGGLRFGEWNMLRSSVHVFYLLLIPAAHFSGLGGVRGFAAASLLANAAMIVLALALHRRAARRSSFAPTLAPTAAQRPVWRDLLRYGASVHLGAAVAIIAERLDQMIIALLLPAADLGLFVIALTVSRLPLVLAITLATVAFPKIAGMSDEAARLAVLGRYVRATTLAVVPMSLALAAVTPWLVPLFFGASFAAATPVAWVLTAAVVPLSLKTMIASGLKACDRGWLVGQAELVTLALSAGALALLVPTQGLMGAAAAGAIAQSGALIFLAVKSRKALGTDLTTLFVPRSRDLAFLIDTVQGLRRRTA